MPLLTLTIDDPTLAAWVDRGLDPVTFLQAYMVERAAAFAAEALLLQGQAVLTAYTRAPRPTRTQIDTLLDVPPPRTR